MKIYYFFIALLFSVHLLQAQNIVSINVNGTINPTSAAFIKNGITKAADQRAECLIIHLNTPGGLLKSTRIIVGSILESPVPVVVYVSPGGAHAGSAGVFITMAAHIAAMSPSTNIGSAHPVSSQGSMDSIMSEKTTNDAAAFIRSIAGKRRRNLIWAEDAVRNSVSITEVEAVKIKVVDLIAKNEQDLLRQINGRVVELESGNKILQTLNAKIERVEMSFVEKFLDVISDPNVAYILMMLGFYGILFELYSPGSIVPGVIGAICLILAFYAMHTLPINYAGMALIGLAIILFVLEIKIVSYGVLGIGAVIALAIGSMMLIKTDSALDFMQISLTVILAITITTALFFSFLIGMAVKGQKIKVQTGIEGIIGEEGEALASLEPSGMVRVHGELWKAESVEGKISTGQRIKVTAINNLTLFVKAVNKITKL
ncbi:MAG: nodulation protein NfeD [Flavobacterium sp.]|nr:nodulation protein NfeD [Pedobacter sp.]